ncbi:MAG: sugar kinase [Paracoccus sp. (in: a-proteobacteria)]|nr:sugar kinase [Paracoccus sp. (in: a-proteobacteria)]
MRILSIGEAMVELSPAGDGLFRQGFAGDTLNTAWYLRRALPADWSVDYFSAVGQDALSDRMIGFLDDAGIGTRHIARDDSRTVGLYMISLTAGERSFAYWRGQSAARHLADDPARLDAAMRGASLVYLSGITLAVIGPEGRARLNAALDRARANGAKLAFDPNLRPRLWPDPATMCRSITDTANRCDIVLPSYEDEASFFGDTTPQDTAQRYAAPLVVVKNGAGEILSREGETLARHAPQMVAQVVDTTAAGDSFNAGFLAAHLTGAPLDQAVLSGARLAARVIGARGALVSL